MYNLLIGNYNNYFNRIVKKEETYSEVGNMPTVRGYLMHMSSITTISNINFNPNDGLSTKVILGAGDYTLPETNNPSTPDYAVLYETQGDPFNDGIIKSRWFILECVRTRGGQYELTLRRDVLVDHYNEIIDAPIFLEKGYIDDVNDPLLYNSEAMNFNQIKQLEIPLKDETKSGWVVGYIPSDAFNKTEPQYDRVEKDITIPMSADITVNGLSTWSYWNYCSNNPNYRFMADTTGRRKVTVKIRSSYVGTLNARTAYQDLVTADYTFYPNSTDAGLFSQKNSGRITASTGTPVWNYPQWYIDYEPVTLRQGTINASICNSTFDSVRNNAAFNAALNTILGSEIVIGDTSALKRLQDKIILDSSTSTYYRINIITTSEGNPIKVTSSITGGQTALDALNSAMTRPSTLAGNYATFEASNSSTSYAIQLTNVGISVYVDLNSDRAHLSDAPYDMFCIPYSDTLQLKSGSTTFTCSKNIALGIATEIAKDLGSGSVYDVQLLPYCPNRTLVVNSGDPSSVLDLSKVKYDLIKESSTNSLKSAIIWCTESAFQISLSTEDSIVAFTITDDSPYRIKTETYYQIPNNLQHFGNRRAVGTNSDNNIIVYKVDKATNSVIDSG